MSIKKILFISWIILAITACILFFALYHLQEAHITINEAYQARQQSLSLAAELQESSQGLTRSVRQYSVTGDPRYTAIYNSIVKVRSGAEARPANSDIAAGKKISLIDLMKEAKFTQQELSLLQQANNLSDELISLETQAMNAVGGSFRDSQGGYTVKGAPDKTLAMSLVFSPAYDSNVEKIMAPIESFQKVLKQRLDATVQESMASYQQAMLLLVVLVVIWLFIFATFLVLVKKMIVTPTLQCQNFATLVAQGKLDSTLDYSSENEIGALASALTAMVSSLRERISLAEQATQKAKEQSILAAKSASEAETAKLDADAKRESMFAAAAALEEVVHVVSSASTQLSSQIEESERGADQQASRVAETATAMEEMTSTVIEVSRNATEAAKNAAQARLLADQGSEIVKQTVRSTTAVQEQSLVLKDGMASLGEHAKSINQIMNVISDIADQTNLLALNAAIEAARAGDAGRGFAVVADEVRKLAEKTMSATVDVGRTIQSIQVSAEQNIQQVETTVHDIEEATRLVSQSGDALSEIVRVVDTTADQVHAIATASEQQSATSEEINRSIVQVNAIARETSTAMHESAQAVSDLARQAHALSGLITNMRKG